MSVCMFEINPLTPQPIPTKFCVATIHNPATNISLELFHFILNPEQRRVFQLVLNTVRFLLNILVNAFCIKYVIAHLYQPKTNLYVNLCVCE
jgi:hypothetical protein